MGSVPGAIDDFGVAAFVIDQQKLNLLVLSLGKEHVAADGEILPNVAWRKRKRGDLVAGLERQLSAGPRRRLQSVRYPHR